MVEHEIRSRVVIEMNLSERIVTALLGEARPKPIRVRIQRANGEVIDGEFNGYWDLRDYGRGMVPSVGYPMPDGSFSHGLLKGDEKIMTPVPSPEEWAKLEAEANAGIPQKATFWASSGSGAY